MNSAMMFFVTCIKIMWSYNKTEMQTASLQQIFMNKEQIALKAKQTESYINQILQTVKDLRHIIF